MEGNKKREHIFAICAYKESPYLEECILSLEKQTRKSSIIMVTSTPNHHRGIGPEYCEMRYL